MGSAAVAKDYYNALGERDFERVERCFHPEVEFIAPLAQLSGKEAVFEAAKRFTHLFNTLKIRECFGSGEQAVVVYDLECPAPVGNFSTAVLVTCREGLIAKLELFFDARPFEKKI